MHHGLNLVYLFVFFLIRGLYLCDRDIVSDWGHSWEIFSQLIFFLDSMTLSKIPHSPKVLPGKLVWWGGWLSGNIIECFQRFWWEHCNLAVGNVAPLPSWMAALLCADCERSKKFQSTPPVSSWLFLPLAAKSAQIIGSQIIGSQISANHLSFIMISEQLFTFAHGRVRKCNTN